MSAILQVNNLHKSFGGIVAARDINLKVDENQVHAVVGPNGAGKTTLVSQLAGLIKPDSGKIWFRGKNISTTPPHRRVHEGLVRSFQITSVFPPMTLLENVSLAVQSCRGHCYKFWAAAANDHAIAEQAMHALQQVGLAEKACSIASTISHGEQRQLEIAMALALQPKLLLLDEPMAGMSRQETDRMIALLHEVKSSRSILLIEHDMDAVFALADITSVLVDGAIIACGNTAEIRGNHAVQKAYLGESWC